MESEVGGMCWILHLLGITLITHGNGGNKICEQWSPHYIGSTFPKRVFICPSLKKLLATVWNQEALPIQISKHGEKYDTHVCLSY